MRTIVVAVGGITAVVVGCGGILLGLVRPWMSCPEIDDGSAACPADATSQVIMLAGMVVVAAGVVLIVIARSRDRVRFENIR